MNHNDYVAKVNGEAASGMVHTGAVSADIVFPDLNLPLMSGHQFLQELNRPKILQNVPVTIHATLPMQPQSYHARIRREEIYNRAR